MPSPLRVRITRDELSPTFRKLAGQLDGPARRRLLTLMAKKFASITKQNFGRSGVDRPFAWKSLNPKYAKWKKKQGARPFADLLLNKDLFRSIRAECNSDEYSTVTAYSDYAETHQFGGYSGEHKIPARPFMPIDGAGNVTPKTRAALLKVAEEELRRLTRS